MSSYTLPSSPAIVCQDRFSILEDSDELYVPFWSIVTKVLQSTAVNSAASLVDLLETIAVTRRGKSDSDYGSLKAFVSNDIQSERFCHKVWPALRCLALEMPVLFPSHGLPILEEGQAQVVLSRRQVACLVIHQFLCTVDAPTWQDGYQDFHIWYSDEQPHAQAVQAYLAALFEYFFRLAADDQSSPLNEEWPISYALHTCNPNFFHLPQTTLSTLTVLNLPEASTSPSVLGLPDGAAVVSANKFIGFGRTGTQEETHVGASPECCPAVLVTPPLMDDQAVVVSGAEAMVTISGYGRDARCTEILVLADNIIDNKRWQQRSMLFMDALELDLSCGDAGLPDLQSCNVARDIRKAYTAFHSRSERPYSNIYTGYWGCRSFGGNPAVKALIQWCAASFAGCLLTFVCSDAAQHNFGSVLEEFVREMVNRDVSANALMDVLLGLAPDAVQEGESVLDVVREKLLARANSDT